MSQYCTYLKTIPARVACTGCVCSQRTSHPGRRYYWVAVPGTSEHQLGLAVDIVDVNYQLLDTNQENTAVQKWLLENSWRYGFILRYPTDQTDVTGIVYEPWHYRYVGKEYAQDIYKKGLCLEQYLEQWGK